MSWLESHIYRAFKFLKDLVTKSHYIWPIVMTIGKDVEGTRHGLIRGNNKALFLYGLTKCEENFRIVAYADLKL
jgi:hypothetical protein